MAWEYYKILKKAIHFSGLRDVGSLARTAIKMECCIHADATRPSSRHISLAECKYELLVVDLSWM